MTLRHDAYIGSNYGSRSGDRAPDIMAGPRRVLTTNSKELRTMGAFPSTRRRRARGLLAVACGAAAIAITAAACGSSGTSSASGAAVVTPTGGTPITGGTATYALPPSTVPNYIFPFTSSTYFSVSNSAVLPVPDVPAALLVRQRRVPDAEQPALARQPAGLQRQQRHDQPEGLEVVQRDSTITAQNVLFWIHMLQAVGASDWGAYVPGGFPTNVTNVKATNADHAHHDDEQGLQPDLVHLQRAEPDHPDAGGLGPHRERARATARPRCPTAPPSTPTSTASPRTCRAGRARRCGRSSTGRGS